MFFLYCTTMATFYESLGNWFKGKLSVSVLVLRLHTTEWIFRLHYIWTTWLLLIFVSMLCWKEWIGGHIKCLPIEEDTANVAVIPIKVINSFCYVSSTFSVSLLFIMPCPWPLPCSSDYMMFIYKSLYIIVSCESLGDKDLKNYSN